MKSYIVYVYYWPAEGQNREQWLGYTTWQGDGKDRMKVYRIEAATRGKAITKAIQLAKANKGKIMGSKCLKTKKPPKGLNRFPIFVILPVEFNLLSRSAWGEI